MSRQRSHSPRYRTFPWEEPDFDPQKVVAELDRMPLGWGEEDGPRDGWGDRRHPQHQQWERERRSESYHRRRSSPYHEPPNYLDADDRPRHREAFRENIKHYEDRRGEEQPEHNRNYTQREPGWRQDQPDSGSRERFRDRSPQQHDRNNSQRGRGRGTFKRSLIHRDKWTPNPDSEQPRHINRNRREMDGSPRSGCEWEEQRYSADERREGFYRNDHEPQIFEQKRNKPMEPPRSKHSSERGFRSPRSSRSMSQEDTRGGHFVENRNNDGYHEERRSPFANDRPNYDKSRDRPANRGGNRGNFNRRGRFNHRGRGWPRGNRPNPQRVQSLPNEQPRFRAEEELYDEPEPAWEQREVGQAWEDDEDHGREIANSPSPDLEMQQPREQWGSNETKPNMMVITEETLTIKVDMSRPVNKNSLMLYSADRPLSLDLVHVGRQRLDFLSSAEHPGENSENAVQTGTFAQEIITLVHKVKDQYFGGQGITLTERFSTIKMEENEEPQEMTLNKRFSANRGLNINYSSLTEHEEPLFSKHGPLQLLGSPPLRDPDDLRHDLEKRRQERRQEGVKITIAGQSRPQRPQQPKPLPPSEETYEEKDLIEEFSNWSEEPQWRQEGPTGSTRGGGFRPFRRNNRPMRRPNYRSNSRGQNW
uniref:BCLAF1 and THRAP3 family member 3 n=1 Tax=Neogobius melanostomus TaxID=47308 RepID=A0A8C6T2C3_9GOBI